MEATACIVEEESATMFPSSYSAARSWFQKFTEDIHSAKKKLGIEENQNNNKNSCKSLHH
jgi:hypothetical protein